MKKSFYCKYCGEKFTSVFALSAGVCSKNPSKNGKHVLYEGSEKLQYVCKYCGTKAKTISLLTSGSCSRNPDNMNHEPAIV